jgi:hypothetical protein
VLCWMRRLRRADFPAAVDEAVSLVRFYVALSLALSSPSSSYFNDSRRAQILNRSLLASPVLAYNACKRRPRGSFRGGRADGSQIWFRFACDHRWRLSRSADTARGHGRASRGEKRQRSSGHRSESVLPVCRLLSPNSPAACGPDGGEGGAWFAPGRSMVQGPALLGALRATTHLPCVWAAGRRAAAVGSAKGYGDLRRTPRLATLERPRE